MQTLLQITNLANSGSVGRIAEQIGQTAINNGWESHIAYARKKLSSQSNLIKIGSKWDIYLHGFFTRIFDNHGFKSKNSTRKLIKEIEKIKPSIIHLHYMHGYYINIDILFRYLSRIEIPIIWTFHDCWSFTGHCAYYDYVGCQKWQTTCYDCPQKKEYPASYVFNRSRKNFIQKKELFSSIKNTTIVPVSYWLQEQVLSSFLKNYNTCVIQNGIDTSVFSPQNKISKKFEKYDLKHKFVILGVASKWERRKGLEDFIKLQELLDDNYQIILVGLKKSKIRTLSHKIIGIERTENMLELAELYSLADVFINPTWEDTFPTTNLEALACGTPIITYNTGGSIESVSLETGFVVEKGDIRGLKEKIDSIKNKGKDFYSKNCRKRAEKLFDKKICFQKYLNLYQEKLTKKD